MKNEKPLKKILNPIDGSVSSHVASETALIIAKKTGAYVTVFHNIHYHIPYTAMRMDYGVSTAIIDDVLDHYDREADKIANHARALFSEEGIALDMHVIKSNDPAQSILDFSEKDYDLIVMGVRGEHVKNPYSLGSITKQVIRNTKIPTLITKKVSALTNMLVCLDGSEHSIKTLDYAVRFAEKMDSRITLLNVQENQSCDLPSKVAKRMGERFFAEVPYSVGKKELKIGKKIEFGVPSDTIVEVAEKRKHDLIVLGSRGLGRIKRFLRGSTNDAVSCRAKCSVLIVP